MTNKKVRISLFLKKTMNGGIKKQSELSTPCGIEAIALIHCPDESMAKILSSPIILPRVVRLIRERIREIYEQRKKEMKEKREKEITRAMFDCVAGKSLEGMKMADLRDLGSAINRHLNEILERQEYLKKPAAEAENETLAEPTMEDGEEGIDD